jgi:hypothetical protein
MFTGAVPLPSIHFSKAHIEQLKKGASFRTYIPEMTGSNLSWDTGCPDGVLRGFPQIPHANFGIASQIGQDRFFPHLFQFIVH